MFNVCKPYQNAIDLEVNLEFDKAKGEEASKKSTSSADEVAPTHPKAKRVTEPTKATKWGHEPLPGEGTGTGKWHCLYQIVKSLIELASLKLSSTGYSEENHRGIRNQFDFTNKHAEGQMSATVLRANYLARTAQKCERKNFNVRARSFIESRQNAWDGYGEDGDLPSDVESEDGDCPGKRSAYT